MAFLVVMMGRYHFRYNILCKCRIGLAQYLLYLVGSFTGNSRNVKNYLVLRYFRLAATEEAQGEIAQKYWSHLSRIHK